MPQPAPKISFSPAVVAAIDTIVAELSVSRTGRKRLESFLASINDPYPKLPGVSFFAPLSSGGVRYRAQYKLPGHKRRTERLGRVAAQAYKRVQHISEIMQRVEAKTMKVEDAYRELYVGGTLVTTQIDVFAKSLKTKGSSLRHIEITITRLRRCVEMADVVRLNDLSRSVRGRLLDRLRVYVDPMSKKQIGTGTINDYLAVMRQFTRWAHGVGLIVEDVMANSVGIRQTDEQKRRDLLPDEIAQILRGVRAGLIRADMPSEERAMMYLTAFATGFRRSEIRAIQRAWVNLDDKHPNIVLPPEITKDRKGTKQALPKWFTLELGMWMGDNRSGKLFPNMPLNVARLFERDRVAARAAWVAEAANDAERQARESSDFLKRETHDGEIVFHCMRHSYSTSAASNLDLKTAQLLTRHATASILTDVYAHSRFEKAAEGVEAAIKDPTKAPAQSAAKLDEQ